MEYGCIGEHLTHSFSKEIHARLFPYKYELCELSPDEVGDFLKARNFRAINVTIPYKQTVIPYLDEIDENAKSIGAVNTVVNRDGKLYGYNTDFLGMRALIEKMGLEVFGKKVLVLGSGGTSKTAESVAKSLGAREVYRLSREEKDGTITYAQAERNHADADIIINTTPCGMYPKNGIAAIDIERFPSLSGVVDAVYNPLRPTLVLKARERGIAAEGGLYMLVAQAVYAAEYFKDQKIEKERIEKVYSEILKRKKNLVLIGMPGSGKSTLGKMAAAELSMPFVDTDCLITEKTGKTAAEIIKLDGEKTFRDIEEAVVREVSSQQGVVIATGGGAILREENRRALKENGTVIFLDRPIDKLATANRPLSSDIEKLKKRYAERYDIYCALSDKKIKCVYSKQENLKKIKDAFLDENIGN